MIQIATPANADRYAALDPDLRTRLPGGLTMIFDRKDNALDALAAQWLRVRELVDTVGDPLLRAAIDLLLLEVARALAESCPQERASGA
ncbi:hypothetical protein SAMN02799622_03150 [Methylobacterium sp. UNC378MF]|uniref:hypothetical protein n=1 Tax=Methylobacterium sp. UNC378MF TaxID=1502748 RepID=UPI00088AF115|nr:hypothetical protein [Methylobacterium sp. UNC378MF]SDA23457.1 hypothetical protein SAMN02799622_03150 [Methylobacterium sp. UNC378MF]